MNILKSPDNFTQLYTRNMSSYHLPISDEHFEPIENCPFNNKPLGGIWTSSFIDDIKGSEWTQINLKYNSLLVPLSKKWHSTLLYPKPDAKILVIDSYEDLYILMKKYHQLFRTHYPFMGQNKRKYYALDFKSLSSRFDALHITKKGIKKTKETSNPINLEGWDVESTLWFNLNSFEKIDYIGSMEFEYRK